MTFYSLKVLSRLNHRQLVQIIIDNGWGKYYVNSAIFKNINDAQLIDEVWGFQTGQMWFVGGRGERSLSWIEKILIRLLQFISNKLIK